MSEANQHLAAKRAQRPAWQVVQQDAESWSAQEVLRWADETYGEHAAIASAFGVDGIALIDMASEIWRSLRVFILDTGFLFPETYRLIERVEQRYQIAVQRIMPALTPAAQERISGPELWKRDPDRCCRLRKIDPLRQKLTGLHAWVTSIRRDQTPERSSSRKVEWDRQFQLVKINPLAEWTAPDVWNYVRERKLPYNPLHDRHYPSIGCTHCTSAVVPGEDPRSGRWPDSAKRECGMHVQLPSASLP
jgi:phosphoadenosine phosphosulfate reductase